jgi:hypothetical protein
MSALGNSANPTPTPSSADCISPPVSDPSVLHPNALDPNAEILVDVRQMGRNSQLKSLIMIITV